MDNEAAVTEEQKKTNDIYIGPGQEKHLEHELGHVIRQRSGRVNPIAGVGDGLQLNTGEALQQESDLIGWTPLPEGKSDIEHPSE